MANGTGTVTLDFGTGDQYATVSVTAQSGCTTGAFCEAWIMRDETADHSDYEHMLVPMDLRCGDVTGSGFTIHAVADFPLTGQFKVRWVWHYNAITCTYALNDDGTVAALFGGVVFDGHDAGYQVMTHTYQAGDAIRRIGVPADAASGVEYSGIVAVQAEFAASGTTDGYMQLGVYDVGAGTYADITVEADSDLRAFTDGTLIGPDMLATGVTQNGAVVGLYLNTATGQVGLTCNGTDYGYKAELSTGPWTFFVVSSNPDSAESTGKDKIITLISNAADMTQPFPAGATDPCGNTI